MIHLKNVSKWYDSFQVLDNCSTSVSKGEVVVVCGPSGSGKSTLIKAVNGLEPVQKGEITVDGMVVSDKKTNLNHLRHIDSLDASGQRGSRIYGLQKAMRNIYAHNHFSIPFYLKATKHQQYINAASFSGNSALKHLVYKNENSEEIILNLLSNKKFRDSCLSIIAALAYKDLAARAFYILVLPKDKDDSKEYSFWYRDLSVLKKASELQEYTNKVSSHGKPAILKVELKKSDKVQNMYYRDEITYLKTLDKDLADDLEVQLYNTIGIGEVTDLTDIAIKMISNTK